MELSSYFKALRRRWWVLGAALAVALAVGWTTSTLTDSGSTAQAEEPSYRATTRLLSSSGTVGSTLGKPGTIGSLDTIAALTTIGQVPDRVAEEIGYEGDPRELASRIRAAVSAETGFLQITAKAASAAEAEELADGFAEELIAYLERRQVAGVRAQTRELRRQIAQLREEMEELDREIANATAANESTLKSERDAKAFQVGQLSTEIGQLDETTFGSELEIIEKARAQRIRPSATEGSEGPPLGIVLTASGILGLLAGVGLVLLVERLDNRIRTRETAERNLSLPVLAEIPVLPRRQRGSPVVAAGSVSPAANAFRLLASSIGRSPASNGGADGGANSDRGREKPQVILVTSSGPAEGKSTIVANLAASFAESRGSVLVVSCDFRRPRVHEFFGLGNSDGLSEALESSDGKAGLSGRCATTPVPGVSLVSSGVRPANPEQLLSSERMRSVLKDARRRADIVLLDTPPVLTSSDVVHLLPQVDAVLLVAGAQKTAVNIAKRASGVLKWLGAPLVGLVLNEARESVQPRRSRRYRRAATGQAPAGYKPEPDQPAGKPARAGLKATGDSRRNLRKGDWSS